MKYKKFLIINGPNLNRLGRRENSLYGDQTLQEIIDHTKDRLLSHHFNYDIHIEWYQSNIEGEIVDKIQNIIDVDAIVINPAGYSHTSVSIFDALLLLSIPVVEVHLSQLSKREDFRQKRLTGRAAKIITEGLGKNSYYMGILSQLI